MAVYLARTCPKCRNYFGVVIREPAKQREIHTRSFAKCGYEVNWTLLPGHGSIQQPSIKPHPAQSQTR